MQKILDKFYEVAAIKSRLANFIWKGGMILNTLICFIGYIYYQNKLYILSFFVMLFLLLLFSNIFFVKKAAKKVGLQITFIQSLRIKNLINIYNRIDEFQKDWITKYCKNNKLNNIEKLNILRQEIKLEDERKTIIYINPIIIGTLLISIWDIAIEKIVVKVGFWNMLFLAFVLVIGLSIFIGLIRKIFLEDREFFVQFEMFSNRKRLEELILYRILKSKK